MRGWRFVPVVVCAVLFARGASAQDAASLAQQRFSRGTRLYGAHDFEAALTEFRAAQAIFASPNERFYIARCLRDLGRIAEAVPELELTVQEAEERARTDPRYTSTASAARRMLEQLQPQIGRVVVNLTEFPPGATVRLGANAVPAAALGIPLPVMPGRVSISAEAPGFLPATRDVEVNAGAQVVATLTLTRSAAGSTGATTHEPTTSTTGAPLTTTATTTTTTQPSAPPHTAPPPPAPPNAVRAIGWTGVVLGGLGLASFGVFGGLTFADYNRLTGPSGPCAGAVQCPQSEVGAIHMDQTFQLIANTSLIAGGAVLVLGGILVLAAPGPPRRAPQVAFGPQGLAIRGVF